MGRFSLKAGAGVQFSHKSFSPAAVQYLSDHTLALLYRAIFSPRRPSVVYTIVYWKNTASILYLLYTSTP